MSPQVDYPWAIPFWSHPNNYYRPDGHSGVPNKPKGFVLHTPEEPAGDGYPGTPNWFAKDLLTQYGYSASTHYFLEAVEDPNRPGFCKVYQCVPENCAAVANGVLGKPYPSWADRNTSLNWQSLSLEWEGYAASIDKTIDAMQMRTAAHLIAHRAAAYGFPTDREHVIGHYQVSNERTDPGPRFPWDALMRELEGGDPVNEADELELADRRAAALVIDAINFAQGRDDDLIYRPVSVAESDDGRMLLVEFWSKDRKRPAEPVPAIWVLKPQ